MAGKTPLCLGVTIFNLVKVEDKSNGVVNHHWVNLFNDRIDSAGLIELNISGRAYTWGNSQDNLIYANIDRILASTNWESHFPLTTLKTLLG